MKSGKRIQIVAHLVEILVIVYRELVVFHVAHDLVQCPENLFIHHSSRPRRSNGKSDNLIFAPGITFAAVAVKSLASDNIA